MTKHVFVCYARKDQDFTLKLADNLRKENIPIWIDQRSISPGADWDMEIDNALYGCSTLMIILSENAVNSPEVRAELRTALDENKRILPIIYRECRMPRQLKVIQYVDFSKSGPDDESLLRQVVAVLGSQHDILPKKQARSSKKEAPESSEPWLVSKSTFAKTTAEAWGNGTLRSIGDAYEKAVAADGMESIIQQFEEMFEFFEINNLPYFKGEVHVSGAVGQSMRTTTYRMILTMPDGAVKVFPFKDMHSYTFKGTEGSLRGLFLGSVLKFSGTFGQFDLSSSIEHLYFPTQDAVNKIRAMQSWKSLPAEALAALNKRRNEI